jgi:hypothetical protein
MIDNIGKPRTRPAKIRRMLKNNRIEVTFTERIVKDVDPLKNKEFVPGYTRILPHKRVKQFVIMDVETHEIYALAPNQYVHKTIAVKEGTVIPYITTEKGYARYDFNSKASIGNINTNIYKYHINAINAIKTVNSKTKNIEVDFVIKLPK